VPILSPTDQEMLAGGHGPAVAIAMRLMTRYASAIGAERLIDVTGAHIDSCLFHGQAGLDFAELLAHQGAQVRIPTTLNVSSLDLLHPDLYRGDPATRAAARRLMAAYESMGAVPSWTCAPYQLPHRPGLGEHVAWAESNAIVFANSVLGARTDRYGDFIDICAAITGRVPAAGLHLDEMRSGTVLVRVDRLPEPLLDSDALYPVLGHLVGHLAGDGIPVIHGLPTADEDRLKALGAGAASSGSVAMFHAVGITPEAPTVAACTPSHPIPEIELTLEDLRRARDELSTVAGGTLGAVSIGTPHASAAEIQRIAHLLGTSRARVPLYVNTGRDVLAGVAGLAGQLEGRGVVFVTDTCTYITPIIDPAVRTVMTESAKWAYYAPANLGVDVVFGTLEDCVASAVAGSVTRDEQLWSRGT
jgi:predicted aconitase